MTNAALFLWRSLTQRECVGASVTTVSRMACTMQSEVYMQIHREGGERGRHTHRDVKDRNVYV